MSLSRTLSPRRWVVGGVAVAILISFAILPAAAQTPKPGTPPPAAPGAPPSNTAVAPASDTSDSAKKEPEPGKGGLSVPRDDPFPSTYKAPASPPFAIRNATLLTAAGPVIPNGTILVRDGKIVAVGASVDVPAGTTVIDAGGKFVTPGIVDDHSHLGVYAAPGGDASSDGNEATKPNTAEVWAEHSVWPQDPQFPRNLAGGVTTLQVLPGSANLFGGRSVVLKVVPGRTVQDMKFPGAPYGLKMACGENPKRVYAQRGPSTRMGNVAGYRAAWIEAEQYRRKWDTYLAGAAQTDKDKKGSAPDRDLARETLADVLRGNILVHNHCYRADEMAQMIDIAKEFGYEIRSFHHVVEGYKIADRLAAAGIAASIWADWGGFKMEALDGVKANAAILQGAGARAIIHSDDPSGSQRLNQEAAKAMAAGAAIGLPVAPADAIKWVTLNPAWALGLDDRIGSLEPNKNADLVLWSGDPFSVYTRVDKVWIDGALRFDRAAPDTRWRTDFELGFVPAEAR
jgi:imidazolonepropionase-like amidohydrolase